MTSIPKYQVGMFKTVSSICVLVLIEWLMRKKQHGLEIDFIKNRMIRWFVYYLLIAIILQFGANSQSFIYFQF